MSIIVLVNIGARDVLLDGKSLYPAREEGKEAWESYEKMKKRLSFPIFQPLIDKILKDVSQIDQLIFYGTDQSDKTNEEHRRRDTLYFAKIAACAMKEHPHIDDAISTPIKGINPSLYDEASDFFKQNFSNLDLPATDKTTVYLLPTGGMPACSMGMLLQGLTLFGERCHVLYQQQLIKEKEAEASPIGSRLHATFQRQTAVYLLQQFNFHAAGQAAKKADIHNPLITDLISYASARLWFSFDDAGCHLAKAIANTNGDTRTALTNMQKDLTALKQNHPEALLGELYHNARIAWENGRLLDFLTRWFRFQQTALAIAIGKMPADTFFIPVNVDELNNTHMRQTAILQMGQAVQQQAAHELSTKERGEIAAHMELAYTLAEIEGLCFDLGIDHENIAGNIKTEKVQQLILYCERRRLVGVLMQENRAKRAHLDWGTLVGSPLYQLVQACQRLEKLRPLYENSILAAGVGGVTEETITKAYQANEATEATTSNTNPLDDMAVICSALTISIENPYRVIRDILIERVRR